MSDHRQDDLFVLQTQDFVAARNALAKALKAEGKADEAAQVAKLRRPSPVVAAVNRAARAGGAAVDALIEAEEQLRRAQSKSQGQDLRAAMQAHRDALRGLAEAAESELPKASPAQQRAIQATLQGAAAGGKELRDRLRRGVLEEELEAPGFDALSGLTIAVPAKKRVEHEDEHEREKKRREEEKERKRAEAEAARLEREAQTLAEKADRLEEQAREARKAADEAAERARRAKSG